MVLSTSIILSGLAVVVHFSPGANPHFDTHDVGTLKELYTYAAFQVYMASLLGLSIGAHLVYRRYRRAQKAGQALSMDQFIRPLTFSLTSASLGSQSTLQAKCLSSLLVTSDPVAALTDYFTYFVLIGFVAGTAFWLIRMNRALAYFEPMFVIPVLQVCWTFFAT
jgi:fructose-specific phosphotransferase system IIC component